MTHLKASIKALEDAAREPTFLDMVLWWVPWYRRRRVLRRLGGL